MARHLAVDGEPVLTKREVADLLRVNRFTVTRWTRAGLFPEGTAIETDQGTLYRAAAVWALRDECEVKP